MHGPGQWTVGVASPDEVNKQLRITNGHKRISEQNGDVKSDWHYTIQWQSNTLFLSRRIRQNKKDLLIWNKDKYSI